MRHVFRIVAMTIALVSTTTVAAQKETTVRTLTDSYEVLRMEVTIGNPELGEMTVGGRRFSSLSIAGCVPAGAVGSPMLPALSRLIEVPLCDGFEVSVAGLDYDTLQIDGATLAPMQPSRSKSDTSQVKLIYDSGSYGSDRFIGGTVAVEAVGIARDRRLARVELIPVSYNPFSGTAVVMRRAEVTVRYRGADKEGTQELFRRYHSDAFNSGASTVNNLYPKAVRTAAPVRYLIVAHSMFRGHMDEFVAWKRRKGFMTDIVYTDNPAVGTTTTSIAAYIKSQYTGASVQNPAPTYVLLVGDVEQIPAFNAQATYPSSDHITDLYYSTWTSGDYIPDCYYGRFSAQTVSQLTPQVQKTLMHEQYTFTDPSFLDRAVMVAGVDRGQSSDYGYYYADPAMDYAITNYVNSSHGYSQVHYYKNDTSIIPVGAGALTLHSSNSQMAAMVRNDYSQGAGFINYSAHGSATSWATPNFTTSHVASMTNTQKFGLMIGNCCLTNKFETATCFGESLLRKDGYCGAVGYIGASNSTYWSEDFYWAVGVRGSIYPTMSMAYNASNIGIYDRLFHTHNENNAIQAHTQGSIMMMGNMSVESSSSSLKLYYWEVYHLMGDPSLMPYLTQPSQMSLTAPSTLVYGASSVSVMAVPYAYVAITDTLTGELVAAAYANANGTAVLTLPSNLPMGGYEIAASAQQFRTAFRPLQVIHPAGPFPIVAEVISASLNAGDTVALTLKVENDGNATAHAVWMHLSSSNPLVALTADSLYLDSIPAGATLLVAGRVGAVVGPAVQDLSYTDLRSTCTWTAATMNSSSSLRLRLHAPVVDVRFERPVENLLPGMCDTLTLTLHNSGSGTLRADGLLLTSPTAMLKARLGQVSPFTVASGADTTFLLTLQSDSHLAHGIEVPLSYVVPSNIGDVAGAYPVYVGHPYIEGFENSTYHTSSWQQGNYPWVIIDSQAFEGTCCLRSAPGLGNSKTSEVTIAFDAPMADSVVFHYSVSSEQSYDKLYVLVDNQVVLMQSGEVGWTRASFPLSVGSHTLCFRYEKDYSQARGHDCAWVDGLVLPRLSRSVSFVHSDHCQGDVVMVGGQMMTLTELGVTSWCDSTVGSSVTLTDYEVHQSLREELSVVACDSFSWQGTDYFSSAQVVDSLVGASGCDSIVVLHLTVNHSSSDTVVVNSAATTFEWNGVVYDTSGIYWQVLINSAGCDSTVTLVLTLPEPASPSDTTLVVAEAGAQHVLPYPNPTSGWVYLNAEVDAATVYDLTGRDLFSLEHVSALFLGSLPKGSYLLHLDLGGRRTICRVIRQ